MEAVTRTNPPYTNGGDVSGTTLTKATAGVYGAVDKMAMAADDTVRNVKPAIDQVALMAHQAVSKIASAAAPSADWVRGKSDSLAATQRKVAADAGQYVVAHPLKAIGIALAAGFLLSSFFRIVR